MTQNKRSHDKLIRALSAIEHIWSLNEEERTYLDSYFILWADSETLSKAITFNGLEVTLTIKGVAYKVSMLPKCFYPSYGTHYLISVRRNRTHKLAVALVKDATAFDKTELERFGKLEL